MSSIPPQPLLTHRAELFKRLGKSKTYDIAVVGGGATGLGVALDAAARGFKVVLVESHDFSSGTSSRSTKLVHGGVRYLAQGVICSTPSVPKVMWTRCFTRRYDSRRFPRSRAPSIRPK
jgi:glycerol-3-phosphate dehydrogenase